jgi:ADP-ribose pyrophosphatase
MTEPLVRQVEIDRSNPWFQVITKTIEFPGQREPQTYYSIRPRDYVNVLAQTEDGGVLLVRQYRPVVEQFLLELPGGTMEENEVPAAAMQRELLEETGYWAEELVSLGQLLPDHGRLENVLHAFFAPAARRDSRQPAGPEEGIEVQIVRPEAFLAMIREGGFLNAMQLGMVAIALVRGLLRA